MSAGLRRLIGAWLALIGLFVLELLVTLLLPGRLAPAAVLALGVAMVAVVGLAFMRLGGASGLAKAFVIAALFWLALLLGLGTMDPLTRTDYPVLVTQPI